MGNFNRDNRSGGRRDFGRRDFGGGGRDRQMHKTVCSNCGRECEVPFRPTGDRPVFCSECFEKNKGGSDSRRFDDRNSRGSRFENRDNNRPPQNSEQFNIINAKLDKILAMLTSTSSGKVTKAPVSEVTDIVKNPEEVKMIVNLPLQSEEPPVVSQKKKKAPKKAAATQEI